jgi:hypothetical protein
MKPPTPLPGARVQNMMCVVTPFIRIEHNTLSDTSINIDNDRKINLI